jgi:hypothetical protein
MVLINGVVETEEQNRITSGLVSSNVNERRGGNRIEISNNK